MPFTAEEAQAILKAALSIADTGSAFAATCRWVPWLCAYAGARAGEITQLRVVDVVEREGIHALHLTPAGRHDQDRVAPNHPNPRAPRRPRASRLRQVPG